MMEGQGGRGGIRSVVVALAAMGMLLGGSWLVVSVATASAVPHGTRVVATKDKAAGLRVSSTGPGVANPLPTVPETTPGPSSISAPPSSAPPSSVPDSVAPTPPPVASVAPASTPPTSTKRASAPPGPVREPAGAAQVAAALIVAVDQQSKGKTSIPVTPDNVTLLERWMANEGGLWADNPLNTSLGAGAHAHQVTTGGQDTGIPIFPTMSAGIEATATTLLSNPHYAHILAVLSRGTASCLAFATSVIRSPWASGHYYHDPSGFCSGQITARRGSGHRRHSRLSEARRSRSNRR
jgi:hypothetical protein